MPIMSGYEACKRIRQEQAGLKELVRIDSRMHISRENEIEEFNPSQQILIVALSGLITDSVIEKGRASGFDAFSKALSKPYLI